MKLLSVLALVFSSMSFATSIRPVALESIQTPVGRFQHERTAKIIRVALDGEVFGGTCGLELESESFTPGINYADCEWMTVKFMSPREMRRVVRLTKLAKLGAIQYPNPTGIHCMAMPTHSIRMTANNGSVFLKSAVLPCGSMIFNNSEAAQKLVQELNNLRSEYAGLNP